MDRATFLARTDQRGRDGERPELTVGFVTRNASRRKQPSEHRTVTGRRGGGRHDLYSHGHIVIHPTDGSHPVPIHIDLVTKCNGEEVI